jgi:selenocysteine lyase/cysteine desulfurase
MSRTAFEHLSGEVGRVFREGLLCTMRSQLLGADRVLVALRGRKGFRRFTDDVSFDELLAAAGSVLAWQSNTQTKTRLVSLAGHPPMTPEDPNKARLLEYIRTQIIGADEAIETPYGLTRVTYADYTASGRCLRMIEDYLRDEVMPFYANTHTELSGTGRQTTAYREDARRMVAESVGATDDDAVIFVGSGATGAIDKLVGILGLRIPPDLDTQWGLSKHIPTDMRPVVFIGPYEHHSNILPWRHSIADVVVVDDDDEGRIDLADLERKLQKFASRPLKIGSFSAASNVTGVKTETAPVATLLHRYGALSFWDFAAAGPYTDIAMNEVGEGPDGHLAYKDAVFISPHKFIGGPGTPGVLVVKRAVVKNSIPSQPGGGTVEFVGPNKSMFQDVAEHREEGGTPAILESIRAGLAFRLKATVGTETIEDMERRMVRRAIDSWAENRHIRLLGSPRADRLSIVSFMVRHGGRYLHQYFIVTLLNDLFGIQARGGCSCAGPYMHRLLGIGAEASQGFMHAIDNGFASLRPGWSRVNFNYFISQAEFDYIVQAVDVIASQGWALMADYKFDVASGDWHHKGGHAHTPMRLMDVHFDSGRISYPSKHARLPESALADQLARGRRILNEAVKNAPHVKVNPYVMPEEYNRLRWFVLPHEVLGTANR